MQVGQRQTLEAKNGQLTVIALRNVADSRACLITGTPNAGQFKERNMTSAASIPQGSQFGPINVLGRDFESRTAVPIAPTVFVVDDDIRARESLELLIRSARLGIPDLRISSRRSHVWLSVSCSKVPDSLVYPSVLKLPGNPKADRTNAPRAAHHCDF